MVVEGIYTSGKPKSESSNREFIYIPICLLLKKTEGTVFCPVFCRRAACMLAPCWPISSSSMLLKVSPLLVNISLTLLQNGQYDLENIIIELAFMYCSISFDASVRPSDVAVGGMVSSPLYVSLFNPERQKAHNIGSMHLVLGGWRNRALYRCNFL